ncbi:MAG TPA: radical SAM family heme chaperone HemW [Acidimicrobiales bacterium]|nr:radical SAM family heme chaperone HemW [Acidimicrobiales bacterium]
MHPRRRHRPDARPPRPAGPLPGGCVALAFGAYLHIPFCSRRCDYCAFATWTDRGHLVDRYLHGLAAEIDRAVVDGLPPLTSVFVGGGTPTLVPADGLVEVLAHLPLAAGAEVTVEANPDTVSAESLRAYRTGGVTRMSFGVQSMQPHVLQALGRTHDPDNVRRAVAWTRQAGFDTFNLDLIMGAVGETVADWASTLEEVLALDPPHISSYGLTVEPGTPLAADPDRYPDDDDQADKYLLADRRLAEAGLRWYEVSNWARPGHECRHNRLYWEAGEYLGFGCAAHSHRAGRRWWNLRTPERYLDAVEAGRPTEAAGEDLDQETRRLEALQLALRTREGVAADALDLGDPALDGLVQVVDGRAVLTPDGRLLANEVAVRLRLAALATPVSVSVGQTAGRDGTAGTSST